MAITGYVRYRHFDYFLNCAALKIEDQVNSVTFQVVRISDISYLSALTKKITNFKKYNNHSLIVITIAAICNLIAGNFRFYQVPIFYLLSFLTYCVLINTYCITVVSLL